MSKNKKIDLSITKSIISYDLSPCRVSAAQICAASNGQLYEYIQNTNKEKFALPNTTLASSLNRDAAITAFKNAVKATSDSLWTEEKITYLFVVDVEFKNCYIENN